MSVSEPTQPVGRTPAWRTIVIAVVAVLAIAIGAFAGSVLLTNRTAAMGSGSAYVPADAAFFVELRVDPSVDQDAALRDILGRFPEIPEVDLERPLYAQAIESIDEMLDAEDAGISWADDVAPWFDGRVSLTVTDIPLTAMEAPMDPMDPMAMPEVPPMLVMLGVTDRSAADGAIGRMLAAAGDGMPGLSTVEHRGVVIHVVEDSELGAYALTDDQLLFGTNAETIQSAIDTHADGDGSLAELPEMSRLIAQLPDDWLMFATFDFTDVMAQAMAESASASPAIADAFNSLMAGQPLRGAMAVSAAEGRLVIDGASDSATGAFARENARRNLAAEVPADALYFSEAGDIGTMLAAVIGPMKEAMAETPGAADEISQMEAALGADLEELVSWIDDGAMAIGATDGEPWAGLVLVPSDMDAAQRRLGQLGTFAGLAALDPSSGLSVSEEDVDGVSVTTITWTDPNAFPDAGMDMGMPSFGGLVVEYAVTDDRAVVGVGDAFVRSALALGSGEGLAAEARYADAVEEFGGAENAGVAWLDFAGVREAIEDALGPLIEAGDPDGMYASEIRPWLLPLDRFISVTRVDGDVTIQRGALLFE